MPHERNLTHHWMCEADRLMSDGGAYEAEMLRGYEPGDDVNGVFRETQHGRVDWRGLDIAWLRGIFWFAVVLSPFAIEWFMELDDGGKKILFWSVAVVGVWILLHGAEAIVKALRRANAAGE